MCGRFSNKISKDQLEEIGIEVPQDYDQNINICPTDEVWAFGKSRKLGKIKWGMDGAHTQVINARSETILERPMFREDFMIGHRCLVVCDSFYEFPVIDERKACVRFSPSDQGLWLMAGIFTKKFLTDDQFQWRMAVLTTSANGVIIPYHDRMPVLVMRDSVDEWFNGAGSSVQSLFSPLQDDQVAVMEVTPKLRKNSYQGDDAHDPYTPPEKFDWL